METVKAFNSELSSLYEFKPPISKAKMTSITKSAIKAIKFYKHVVQSVEKFIQKCKVEYKVPGLYVIDSIVRQSRHQFGAEKDVFAPRFTRNIKVTFYYIFKCSPQEKSKVVRVLNLWQKNNVFPAEIIQPLFDLANPNHGIHKEIENELENSKAAKGNPNKIQVRQDLYPELQQQESCHSWNGQNKEISGNNEESSKHTTFNLDPNVLHQLQHLQHVFSHTQGQGDNLKDPVQFNKKLLDFDYGEEEDEDQGSNPLNQNTSFNQTIRQLLANPELLRQLQNIQANRGAENESIPGLGDGFGNSFAHEEKREPMIRDDNNKCDDTLVNMVEPHESKSKESLDGKHIVSNMDYSHSYNHHQYDDCLRKEGQQPQVPDALFPPGKDYDQRQLSFSWSLDTSRPPPGFRPGPEPPPASDKPCDKKDNDIEIISCNNDRNVNRDKRSPNRSSRYRRRSRSRSRDRKRRSRSRSKTRRDRGNSRSKSREKERYEREKERLEREKERERRKKGLPAVKKDMLCVCSTTLWVGHLSKLVHEEELSDTFGQYGEIISIDLIPPRGCAFICMNRRQDAYRALQKLKSHKLQGKAITLAWAPGKGVKGKEFKDYWDIELGVSYIPWHKLPEDISFDELEEGGMIDEESLPERLRSKYGKRSGQSISLDPQNQISAGSKSDGSDPLTTTLPQVTPNNFPNGVFSEATMKTLGQYPPVPPMLFTPPNVPPCMPLLSNVVGLPPQTALSQLLPLGQNVFPPGQAGAFLTNTVTQAGTVGSLPLPPPPVPQNYDPVTLLEDVTQKPPCTPDKNLFKATDIDSSDLNSRDRNGYGGPEDRLNWGATDSKYHTPNKLSERDEISAADEDLRPYPHGLLDDPHTHSNDISRDEDFRDFGSRKFDDRYHNDREDYGLRWRHDRMDVRGYRGNPNDVSPDRDFEAHREPYGDYPDYDRDRDDRVEDYRYGQRGRYYRGESYPGRGSPFREPYHEPAFAEPFGRDPPFPGEHFRGPRFSMPRPEFPRMMGSHRGHGFHRGHSRGGFGGQFGNRPPRFGFNTSGRGAKATVSPNNRGRFPEGSTREREPRKTRWGDECNKNSETPVDLPVDTPSSSVELSDPVKVTTVDEQSVLVETPKDNPSTDTNSCEPVVDSEQVESVQESVK